MGRKFIAKREERWQDRIQYTPPGNLIVYLATRNLYLTGDIEDEAGEISMLCGMLDLLALDNPDEPIRFWINSDGGSVLDAEALTDTIARVNGDTPVMVIAHGRVMSAAADVVAKAPVGRRFATPRCKFMMHRLAYSLGEDKADAQKIWANWWEKYEKEDMKALAEHLGVKKQRIWHRIKKTWVFGVTEALEFKIIDGIWGGGE
jgi:ATP-dependent Clp protease protease subunit